MTERSPDCPDAGTLVDLALDELTGRDRAAVLDHLMACRRCRTELDTLVDTTERTLLAADVAEPPAGFEASVIRRIRDVRRPTRRIVPVVLVAAAAVLVAAVAVAAILVSSGSGSTVAEARMVTPAGREVGAAWVHRDDPGWVFLAVPGWRAWDDEGTPRDYRLRATLRTGAIVDLGRIRFGESSGDWGTTIPIDPRAITAVAIVDEADRIWCEGTLT